jgi:hypothetical protein
MDRCVCCETQLGKDMARDVSCASSSSSAGGARIAQSGRLSAVIDALCALLLLATVPASALWGAGWLLLQLLAWDGRGAVLSAAQAAAAAEAFRAARDGVMEELRGAFRALLSVCLVVSGCVSCASVCLSG